MDNQQTTDRQTDAWTNGLTQQCEESLVHSKKAHLTILERSLVCKFYRGEAINFGVVTITDNYKFTHTHSHSYLLCYA